jgi:16S rRNA (guanine966-N2)-methyltransferase
VREALFSMLGELADERVLDLFAGSGALGIEALSRGAARAVFVERHPPTVRMLRENLGSLGIAQGDAQVRCGDALAALRNARRRREKYDLILIDPPYDQASALGVELSAALRPLLEPSARVVVESDRRMPLLLDLAVERQRRYGDTTITIHRENDSI